MAGLEEFMNHVYPRVRQSWECDPLDQSCQLMAKHQAMRDEEVARQKKLILEKRWWACKLIHKENFHMYCQEEKMRFDDAFRRFKAIGRNSIGVNNKPGEYFDPKPYEPIRPDDYQRTLGNQMGFSRQPHPNTHREPVEVLQMEPGKRRPMTDPDRPTVSVRLFDNTRREVVIDLPSKKPALPETITTYRKDNLKVE